MACALAACNDYRPEAEDGTGAAGTAGTPATSTNPTTTNTAGMGGQDSTGMGTGNGGGSGEGTSLVARGLLVRYFIDDFTGDGVVDRLADAAPDPLSLPIVYPNNPEQMEFVEDAGNQGLRWREHTLNGMAMTDIADTKILSALDGAGQVTIELVIDPEGVGPDDYTSRFMHIGNVGSGGRLMLGSTTWEGLRFRLNDTTVMEWDINVGALDRTVLHLVLDTTAQTPLERARVFLDGELQEPYDVDGPGLGETIDLWDEHVFVLGNRGSGNRSVAGTMYYAAIYDVAFDANEIEHNRMLLSVNDDTQP